MSSSSLRRPEAGNPIANLPLFFRRWLADPLQMGSIVPSSRTLSRRIAALAAADAGRDGVVIEIGAGTGVISRALLEAGVAPERLVLVEIVPEMAEHLRDSLPGATVLCADAFALPQHLPERFAGRIGSAICGIPLVLLPIERQRRFIEGVERIAPGLGFLLYTYCITSPLPYRRLGLSARREAWTPKNFPPASVWRYRPLQQG
ncbi:phosphoethanolamine methyltransferase [Belnapia sp. T6]|uniref:Phosphoethanolamine methyltransferase n=1 Tax=Belnapia mucosa TaxID=2804532 RepID=A0ABS1V9A2_9PROT|nr:methyltransferase domain-containing protein [Belnapia mucosa]MBL6457716.1 phosphoethanolamine methyltransferase [Belnapia mucosa]